MKLNSLYNPLYTSGGVKYKLFLVMRLTAIMLLIGALHLSAATYSQSISIKRHNASLESIFKDIKKQTGYTFFYTEKVNTTGESLNVDMTNASLKEVLDFCLFGLKLNYTIINKTIVIRTIIPETKTSNEPDKAINAPLEIKGVCTLPLRWYIAGCKENLISYFWIN